MPENRVASLALRPRARLLSTIGEDLISSESVAVIELVKNAYDADATRVLVRFEAPLTAGQGAIEVLDDGEGMSFDRIRDSWLEPATSSRRDRRVSGKGRRVLGEKGIGRFAASRLADRLLLATRPPRSTVEVQLALDWSHFRIPDRYLDEVEVLWQEGPADYFKPAGGAASRWHEVSMPPADHGTLLRLDDLRAGWAVDDLRKLRNDLSRLIAGRAWGRPDAAPDFSIFLELPEEYEQFSGLIEPPQAIVAAPYELSSVVAANGQAQLEVKVPDAAVTSVDIQLASAGEGLACGPFEIHLRVWDRDAQAMRAQAGELGVRDFRALLDAAAGISVYRDGFRVLPYGELGDDWLGLDRRRVQNPSLRVSNNQVIGEIYISAEKNPQLRDQSNREGLMAGPSYDALVRSVREVLAQLEVRRRTYRRGLDSGKSSKGQNLFARFSIADVVVAARERGVDREVVAMLTDKDREITEGIEQVREVLARYSRLATLGRLVDDITHDGQHSVGRIRNQAEGAERALAKDDVDCERRMRDVRPRVRTILDQVEVLTWLFRRIEPFGGRRRGRPSRFDLREAVQQAVDVLEPAAARAGVKVEIDGDGGQVTIDRAELQQIVVNLVDNALYWVQRVPKEQRRVVVHVARDGDDVGVTVSDSGPGVDDDIRDLIFEPYFSTKPDGVGLGLAITGELLVDHYNGMLQLVDGDLGGASFRALFRRRT